jgi:hypothetical protein
MWRHSVLLVMKQSVLLVMPSFAVDRPALRILAHPARVFCYCSCLFFVQPVTVDPTPEAILPETRGRLTHVRERETGAARWIRGSLKPMCKQLSRL